MTISETSRYYISKFLRILADKLHQSKKDRNQNAILNIGFDKIENPKYAAVFYITEAIPYYLNNDMDNCPFISDHSMYWESTEMVNILNKMGYVVDYYDCRQEHPISDVKKYDLIIDESNHLKHFVENKKAIKIFYATGSHWLFHNKAEFDRISQFHQRNNIILPTQRQVAYNESNELADIITYFGNEYQRETYTGLNKKYSLNISITAEEKHHLNKKDAVKNFLWIGSRGYIHKGLDLAVEAFMEMPNLNLYIAGNIECEPKFHSWLIKIVEKHPNIIILGWLNTSSAKFKEILNNCISIVFPSCSEGGAGSVLQAMLYGLIPIVSRDTFLDGQHLGYVIKENDSEIIIKKIRKAVNQIQELSETNFKKNPYAVEIMFLRITQKLVSSRVFMVF